MKAEGTWDGALRVTRTLLPPLPQATYKTPQKTCKKVEFVEIWRRSVCRMPDAKILQKAWRKSRSSQKSRRRRRSSASSSGRSKADDANTTLFTEGQTGEEDDGMVATLVIICRVAPIPSHNRLLILSASASLCSVEILWSGMSAILHVLYHSRPRGSPRTTGAGGIAAIPRYGIVFLALSSTYQNNTAYGIIGCYFRTESLFCDLILPTRPA